MVEIVDGFEENEKIKKRNDLVYKLAVSIFGSKRVSFDKEEEVTIIHNEYETGRVADASYMPNVIYIFRKKITTIV